MTKKLGMFLTFDGEKFFKEKKLMGMMAESLLDENQNPIGAKYTIIVWEDRTNYGDPRVSNVGDTYKVKVIGKPVKAINQPIQIKLIDPSGVVYGDYRNQLSVSAKDIIFVSEGKS